MYATVRKMSTASCSEAKSQIAEQKFQYAKIVTPECIWNGTVLWAGGEVGMIVVTTIDALPDYCYECPCHHSESGYCQADNNRRYSEYRPFWCPLEEQPEIVRCRDCKNGEQGACGYGIDCDGVWHADDWFCADGERR